MSKQFWSLIVLAMATGLSTGCQTENECSQRCNPYNNPCYDPCMPAPCNSCAPYNACDPCNSCAPGGTCAPALPSPQPSPYYQTRPISPAPTCGCSNETNNRPGSAVRFFGQSPDSFSQWNSSEYSANPAPLNATGYATVSNAMCDVPNSITVVNNNPNCLWEGIVGVVGRYFPVEKEEPCREIEGVVNPGSLMTRPVPGASLLEPWKKDSVGYEQRLESTLQSIRRFALVRVWPTEQNTFSVEVIVQKELESMPYPMNSNKYVGSYIYSDTARSPVASGTDTPRSSWTNLGRDVLLEQKILREIASVAQTRIR